ncbi:MAG: hypothetical protein M3Y23_02455 [Actinomycetota bacterium]|nr:hypothetical protein [Actinomycetota bacterium]
MITWDGRSRKVVADGRPLNTSSIVATGDGWVATIAMTPGVEFTIDSSSLEAEQVDIALWNRPAADGVGVAVLGRHGDALSLATIPSCDCGERSCAHAGQQLATTVDGSGLRDLIDMVNRLTISGSLRKSDSVWQPDS